MSWRPFWGGKRNDEVPCPRFEKFTWYFVFCVVGKAAFLLVSPE
jgi:hypothetical protein